MTQLTVENLIKIIIGVLVFVAVVVGLYIFFKDYVIDFFKNIGPSKPAVVLELLK
ncbi:MAG: hypothetical protein AABX68_00880 [Nanoarchaeota archaeon]